ARVSRVDVLVPRRVVEFLGAGFHEDIVRRQFAKVELRAGDPEIAGGHGGNVLDPELGEPLARYPIHRAHSALPGKQDERTRMARGRHDHTRVAPLPPQFPLPSWAVPTRKTSCRAEVQPA